MAVPGVIVLSFFRAHRNHTAMRRLANYMLQLDRGVMNAESLAKFFFYFAENGIALRSRHIGNLHVRGERMIL